MAARRFEIMMDGSEPGLLQAAEFFLRKDAEGAAQGDVHPVPEDPGGFAEAVEVAVGNGGAARHDAEALHAVGCHFLSVFQEHVRAHETVYGSVCMMKGRLGAEGAVFRAAPGLRIDDGAGEDGAGEARAGQRGAGENIRILTARQPGQFHGLGCVFKGSGAGGDTGRGFLKKRMHSDVPHRRLCLHLF